jgi:hypothetical protein
MEPLLQRLDRRLEPHLDWVAVGFVAVGLVVRLVLAGTSWLNSDEIIHFMAGDQPTLALAAQEGLACQHPPLHYWLIFLWRNLGRSDLMLRLPAVLAGAALVWVGYKLLRSNSGSAAGIAALGVLTFAPELVLRSREVRGYIFLLLLVVAAVYCLERAWQKRSALPLMFYALLLALAMLTDFSAFPVVLALGLYVLVSVRVERPGGKFIAAWAAGQALLLVLGLVLYQTQISHLKGFGAQQFAREGWGRNIYFHPGSDSLPGFAVHNLLALFTYIAASPLLGILAAALFLVAVLIALLRPRAAQRRGDQRFGLLVLLPLLVALGMALTGLTPFGGSRHSIVPAVFCLLSVAWLVGRWAGTRLTFVLAGAILLGPMWLLFARQLDAWIAPRDQARAQMTAAVDYLRAQTPAKGLVFCDDQSQVLLLRYLGQGRRSDSSPPGFIEYAVGRFRLVSPVTWTFAVEPADALFNTDFATAFFRFEEAYGLGPGDTVAVFSGGWTENLAAQLGRKYGSDYPGLQRFGNNLSVFGVQVGSEPHMTAQTERKAEIRRALIRLAEMTRTADPGRWTILWPSWYMDENLRRELWSMTPHVLTYAEFYSTFKPGRELSEFLPARAFWVFGTTERHPTAFRYMEEGESFQIGDYPFALRATDPESLVAVYEIQGAAHE